MKFIGYWLLLDLAFVLLLTARAHRPDVGRWLWCIPAYRRWWMRRYGIRRLLEVTPSPEARLAAPLAVSRRFGPEMGLDDPGDRIRELVESAVKGGPSEITPQRDPETSCEPVLRLCPECCGNLADWEGHAVWCSRGLRHALKAADVRFEPHPFRYRLGIYPEGWCEFCPIQGHCSVCGSDHGGAA